MLWVKDHPKSDKLTYLLEEANELKDMIIDGQDNAARNNCVNIAVFAMKLYENLEKENTNNDET